MEKAFLLPHACSLLMQNIKACETTIGLLWVQTLVCVDWCEHRYENRCLDRSHGGMARDTWALLAGDGGSAWVRAPLCRLT